MEIKEINKPEIRTAIRLIEDVFMEFEAPDYSKDGIQAFKDTAIYNTDYMSTLTMYGGYIGSTLVGVIATRNNGQHIALFFVNGNHHRQGIGTLLFQHVLSKSPSNKITVNSSPYAVDVYHHLGFIATKAEQEINGIRFTPMIHKTPN